MERPDGADASALIQVTVVWSPAPRSVHERVLQLPAGATVAEALARSEAEGTSAEGAVSLWGKSAGPAQALRDGDRIEICRPLTVDPKVARRERFRSQGARATGLFARRTGKDAPPR